jgi:hypothetical protein
MPETTGNGKVIAIDALLLFWFGNAGVNCYPPTP